MDGKTDIGHKKAMICNGVEFEPLVGDRLLWKLKTPLSFIRLMNSENPPTIVLPTATSTYNRKTRAFDISALVFNNREEFEQYIYGYSTL